MSSSVFSRLSFRSVIVVAEPVNVNPAGINLVVPTIETETVSAPVAELDIKLRGEAGKRHTIGTVREVSLIAIIDCANPECIGFNDRAARHLAIGIEYQSPDATAVHVNAEHVVDAAEADETGLLIGFHP